MRHGERTTAVGAEQRRHTDDPGPTGMAGEQEHAATTMAPCPGIEAQLEKRREEWSGRGPTEEPSHRRVLAMGEAAEEGAPLSNSGHSGQPPHYTALQTQPLGSGKPPGNKFGHE